MSNRILRRTAVVSAVSSALCLLLSQQSVAMTAGTYEASAQGRNGPVNVKVDVTKDRITSVQVTGHKETPGIGTLAVKDLPKAIVEAQTTGVDSVSGATITADALRTAVTAALQKAGAEDKFFKAAPKKALDAAVCPTEADVVIVGAGGAGMVAAATAVGQGAKVIVLEKMAMIGGNTARSEGNMSAVDPEPEKLKPMNDALHAIVKKYLEADVPEGEIKDLQTKVKAQYEEYLKSGKKYIFDTPELFALQTLVGSDNKADPKLVLTMAKHATEAMECLTRSPT